MRAWDLLCAVSAIVGALTGIPAKAADGPPREREPATRIDADKMQVWIPFDRDEGGVIFIMVTLNGQPARAMVDTGFTNVTLSRAYADDHHLPLRPVGDARSVGGMEHFDMTDFQSLAVGGWSSSAGAISVTNLSAISEQAGRSIDLVLGSSLLSGFALQIDFDKKRLRLLPSGSRPMSGQDVPVGFLRKGGRVATDISIDGHGIGPVLIDTGYDGELTLTNGAWSILSAAGLRMRTDIASAGAGGMDVSGLTTLEDVDWGRARFSSVQARIEAPSQFLDGEGFSASMGLGFLSRYNVVLDASAGRMTLAPRRHAEPQRPKSTVGVQGIYLSDRMRLMHIMAGSPAAASGLRAGDEICAVNGRAVHADWRNSSLSGWSVRSAGAIYDLKLCSGKHVKLVTADFY